VSHVFVEFVECYFLRQILNLYKLLILGRRGVYSVLLWMVSIRFDFFIFVIVNLNSINLLSVSSR
jgi:hypothetical protein